MFWLLGLGCYIWESGCFGGFVVGVLLEIIFFSVVEIVVDC